MPSGARLIAVLLLILMLPSAVGCSLNITRPAMSGKIVDQMNRPVAGAQIQTIDIGTVPKYTTVTDARGRFKIPRRIDGLKGPVIAGGFKVPPLLFVTTPEGQEYLFWSRLSWNRSRVGGPTRIEKAPEYTGEFDYSAEDGFGDETLTDHYPEIAQATNIFLNDWDWPNNSNRIIIRLLDDGN